MLPLPSGEGLSLRKRSDRQGERVRGYGAGRGVAAWKNLQYRHRMAVDVFQDRTGQDAFKLTQDDLATTMSVRRTTVNASWQELGKLGGIKASRGVVRIASREVLEHAACDCYGALRRRMVAVD